MKSELLRDRTLDWIERLFNGPHLDRFCWAVMIIAALYFTPAVVRIWTR